MTATKQTLEIHAREINNEETLALFLKAQMYCWGYQKSNLNDPLYFRGLVVAGSGSELL